MLKLKISNLMELIAVRVEHIEENKKENNSF